MSVARIGCGLALVLAGVGCGDDRRATPDAAAAAACLPVVHGDALGDGVYRGCDGEGLVIELPGAQVVVDADGVRALKELNDNSVYLAAAGVVGVGVRRCCQDQGEGFCVHLDVQTHTTTVDALLAQLESWFAARGDVCLGVVVRWIGLEAPRCAANDPACEPLPYCPEAVGACCPVAIDHDPAAARVPIAGAAQGACVHDGECFLNGCGDRCDAYTVPGELGTCECTPALQDALCGCVDGDCRWFVEP